MRHAVKNICFVLLRTNLRSTARCTRLTGNAPCRRCCYETPTCPQEQQQTGMDNLGSVVATRITQELINVKTTQLQRNLPYPLVAPADWCCMPPRYLQLDVEKIIPSIACCTPFPGDAPPRTWRAETQSCPPPIAIEWGGRPRCRRSSPSTQESRA